jgi:hypothetical protein
LGGRNSLELIRPVIFVFTATSSVQSHKTHSKVRKSKPAGPDAMPVNIIDPRQFGQGGRSITVRLGSNEIRVRDMMLAQDQAEAQHSQSPVGADMGR